MPTLDSRPGIRALALACAFGSSGALFGCVGELDTGPARPGEYREVPACEPNAGVGAPVPMRRLTQEQVERTVQDVLGLAAGDVLSVPDERLFTYRSNISSSVDVTMARGYLDFAEVSASRADVSRCAAPATNEECVEWLLDDVGFRFFRRPLDAAERARYGVLFETGASVGGAEEGARWVVQALIQSPTFLYLDEVVRDDGTLDEYALAARLSLALWGSGPDRALLERAGRGELASAEQVRAEAERMLDDPRSEGGIIDFVDQWLELHRLDSATVRPDVAALGAETIHALRSEPALFLRSVLTSGGGLTELLTSSDTPQLASLATIYGDDAVGMREGPDGTITELDPTRRAGILSLPGVQTALSHAEETSPTLRGYAVLAGFLCNPPGAPPAGVAVTLPPPVPGATTRERLELHFSDETCAACHRSMDGIGFAFESYDWLGRSRDTEAGREIDDTGTFELGDEDVTVDGPVELAERMSETEQVAECVARQWTHYATGIPPTRDTSCLLGSMATDLRGEGGLREMVLAQVSSDWFRRAGETR